LDSEIFSMSVVLTCVHHRSA